MLFGLIGVAVSAVIGGTAHIKAAHDNNAAREYLDRAEVIVMDATIKRDNAISREKQKIGKLSSEKSHVISGNMQRFVKYFSKIKPVNFKNVGYDSDILVSSKSQIMEISNMCAKINKIPANDIVSGTSGAMLAVGAADMLAGGSLLGGSVVLGGTSVAVGTLVGTVAAPVFALSGINSAINASKNLDDARSVLCRAQTFEDSCETIAQTADAISDRCDLFYSVIHEINDEWFTQAVDNLVTIVERKKGFKNFWKNSFGKPIYTEEEMKSIASTMALAKMLKTLIDTNIIDRSGKVTAYSLNTANTIQRQIHNFNPQEVLAQQTNSASSDNEKPSVKHRFSLLVNYIEVGTVKPYVFTFLMVLGVFFCFCLPACHVFHLPSRIDHELFLALIDSPFFFSLIYLSNAIGLIFIELVFSFSLSDSFRKGISSLWVYALFGLIPLIIGSGIFFIFYDSNAGRGFGVFSMVIGTIFLLITNLFCWLKIDTIRGKIIMVAFEAVTMFGLIFYYADIINILRPLMEPFKAFYGMMSKSS